jgi:hypothetical protein
LEDILSATKTLEKKVVGLDSEIRELKSRHQNEKEPASTPTISNLLASLPNPPSHTPPSGTSLSPEELVRFFSTFNTRSDT